MAGWINRGPNGPWRLVGEFTYATMNDKGAAERQSQRLDFQSVTVDQTSWDEAERQADSRLARMATVIAAAVVAALPPQGGQSATAEQIAQAVRAALKVDFNEVITEVNKPRTVQ